MNRREFFYLVGGMITGTMLTSGNPVTLPNRPFDLPTPTPSKMPAGITFISWEDTMRGFAGEQLAEGCFDNFICGKYSDGVTLWTHEGV